MCEEYQGKYQNALLCIVSGQAAILLNYAKKRENIIQLYLWYKTCYEIGKKKKNYFVKIQNSIFLFYFFILLFKMCDNNTALLKIKVLY